MQILPLRNNNLSKKQLTFNSEIRPEVKAAIFAYTNAFNSSREQLNVQLVTELTMKKIKAKLDAIEQSCGNTFKIFINAIVHGTMQNGKAYAAIFEIKKVGSHGETTKKPNIVFLKHNGEDIREPIDAEKMSDLMSGHFIIDFIN